MKSPLTRVLTIEDFNPSGRFTQDSSASLLRLKGCWFKDAGFPAGTRVTVKTVSLGVIELRVCSPVVAVDAAYVHAIEQLNAVFHEDPKPPGTVGPL